jgi:hypothetical protein
VALINGKRLVGSQNAFKVDGRQGSFNIRFADGFSGTFDTITVSPSESRLLSTDAPLGVFVYGRDARTMLEGEKLGEDGELTLSAVGSFQVAKRTSRWLRQLVASNPGALVQALGTDLSDAAQGRLVAALLR